MDRRTVLHLLAGAAATPSLRGLAAPARTQPKERLAADDEAFLDDMQRRACSFFYEQASAKTGQILDRAAANTSDGKRDSRKMASIAATGFGLSALCLAEKRGYQSRGTVMERVRATLAFHGRVLPHDHGFFSHFNDVETGAAFPGSEISSIDTAILLCGVLTARAHFHADAEIVQLATDIYERVDFPWMLNGEKTFSMGMRRGKFIASRWNHYCVLMMLNLLALGSPTHAVEADTWKAWSRPRVSFAGFEYIGSTDPLFVHQYSHAWFDFRGKRDEFADYFANSIVATRAHRAFCLSLGKPYSEKYWGISASDSEHGYTAWGGPPAMGQIDGSVVPNATAGSLPFLPGECLAVLRSLKENYGKDAWGRYGFCGAFNPQRQWYDPDVLGIDLGISVLMAENLRSGFVWETFARNPEVPLAMKRAGFRAI